LLIFEFVSLDFSEKLAELREGSGHKKQ